MRRKLTEDLANPKQFSVPGRYTIRILPDGDGVARYELVDTQTSRSVKSYRSRALAVSDMSFLNILLTPASTRKSLLGGRDG